MPRVFVFNTILFDLFAFHRYTNFAWWLIQVFCLSTIIFWIKCQPVSLWISKPGADIHFGIQGGVILSQNFAIICLMHETHSA